MTPDQPFQFRRRDVLRTLGAGALALGASAVAAEGESERTFVIEQGDTCRTIEPLGDGSQTVESFYDYGQSTGFSSAGTTDYQRPNSSLVFLYHGSEGLSLVFVHGTYEKGGDGGSASVTITGLPEPVDWVVEDDRYESETSYDRWRRDEGRREVDWTWTGDRTDGGALRGLAGEFDVTVDMQFNEDAALFGQYYDGTVETWELLSGDASDPDRLTLSLSEPIRLRTGSCEDGSGGTGETPDETPEKPDEPDEPEKPDEYEVEVNVRPALQKAIVNPESRVSIPVAVYSTDEFDARTVDTSTIAFGPAGASPTRLATVDLNADGREDLLAFFEVQALGLEKDTEELEFRAETEDGTPVRGSDEIEFFPPFEDDDDDDDDDDDEEEVEREREEDYEDEEDDEDEEEDEDDDDDDDEEEDGIVQWPGGDEEPGPPEGVPGRGPPEDVPGRGPPDEPPGRGGR
ncbi:MULTISPECIES: hypothetical protein [Salinibaculum]|uniref:hypothetical protein n=1 Tax=Salinibaculum TaxID=2732368 RepID=UPI0030D41D05